ncbi:hypothetical protein L249_6602 [Ophiocordyceps polyrhachis-furcata BCC 54312]|uniref:Uncharacterized protein n=1 Tax=Ophiocordyceps polyrhachis-furcata BCC 54312 TaxID=1330021 RepID=A0A367LM19_9HYPO|nr:hypothetical protein L249_6602 [Ophiocordyceps polyrhachis-furcata BCC 54312]
MMESRLRRTLEGGDRDREQATPSPTRQRQGAMTSSPTSRKKNRQRQTKTTSSPTTKTDDALTRLDVNVRASTSTTAEEKKKELMVNDDDEEEEEEEEEEERLDGRDEGSSSPEASSVFDTSVADASWATAATHEVEAATEPLLLPHQLPTRLTREQMREVEVLRLRLGLASYKVRTGQTGIALRDLQARPLRRGGGSAWVV